MTEKTATGTLKVHTGKIKHFPKWKRETPDEVPPMPLVHMCTETMEYFGWVIQLRHDGLHFVCRNCAGEMTLDEVLEAFQED